MKKSILFMSTVFAISVTSSGVALAGPSVTAKENLEILLKNRSCRGCDLSGLNLNRMDLSGADLEGADLSLSKLYLANLSGANLRNAKLNGAMFGGADLGECDLRGADLRGAAIDGAYLGGAQLTGEFVTAKPYESIGVAEVEKEIYLEDQTQSKKSPVQNEVQLGERRDFSETPPLLEKIEEEQILDKPVAENSVQESVPPPKTVRPQPPVSKKIIPVQAVMVDESYSEENKTGETALAEEVAPVSEELEEAAKAVGQAPISKPVIAPVITATAEELAREKTKRDNLNRLLDSNKCYGCDLSGLDLSGENLDGADLEKANLSNCNLEKADLEDANLKAANLREVNLKKADLEGADFYKADLSYADLTGAKQKKTMFDGALVEGAIGIVTEPMVLKK